jgi:hypothetical protein
LLCSNGQAALRRSFEDFIGPLVDALAGGCGSDADRRMGWMKVRLEP